MIRRLAAFLVLLYLVVLAAALLAVPPLMYGQTPPSSPNKKPSLQNSAEHLTTWERLSAQFNLTLAAHERTLAELSAKLEASENNGERLTLLLERLSKQNEGLKSYNSQIGERMYQRDLDLAEAYARIGTLEGRCRSLIIAAAVLSAALLIIIILKLARLFVKIML